MRTKLWRWWMLGVFLGVLVACEAALAKPKAANESVEARMAALEKRIAGLERELALRPLDVSAYALPDEIDFCGEPVDLKDPDIRERIEREFLMILGDRAQVVLWMKRSGKVFPVFERLFRKQGACRDLKYLAVVESGLRSSVTSKASAHGFWQFMAPTARDFGLTVDDFLDERADLEAATTASVDYLLKLHARFGSWPLAMAAYNTGPNRLKSAQDQQGQTDFWRLALIQEAERYVPRIIAVKMVLEHLDDYGFHIDEDSDLWNARPQVAVKVTSPADKRISILALARSSAIDYRVFRHLNPQLVGDDLPPGRELTIFVPKGTDALFKRALKAEIAAATPLKVAKSADNKGSKGATATASANNNGSKKAQPQKSANTKGSAANRGKSSAQSTASKGKSTGKAAKSQGTKTYKVRKGDSLWEIADRHNMTVDALRKMNNLTSKSQLHPGQILKVK